ncbi:MAG: histidine kinase [Trueperaceae bacterium]
MHEVPFFHRLSTRLTLLILVIVAVLAGSAAILLVRGLNLAGAGLLPTTGEAVAPAELNAIIRGTVINLIAVFLFTLIAATLFSRSLLVEPITSLAKGTSELTEGNLGLTLPVTSRSELGALAQAFNTMSLRLSERTRELTDSNEALRLAEERNLETLALLEKRVQERTAELSALLELSNSTALTLELQPLLDRILDRLHEAVGDQGSAVIQSDGSAAPRILRRRGDLPLEPGMLESIAAMDAPAPVPGAALLALPLVVRESTIGVLLLAHSPNEPFPKERVRLASAFANQVAVALENTRLTVQVHERAALEERQHLARELHDSVSQALYAILLGTHAARRQIESDPEAATSALAYVEGLAEAGIAEMRALIFELRPESLEQDGLSGALRKQLDALESRHGLETVGRIEGEPDLSLTSKQVLFRVAQEALHNVVKHAKAARVELRLVRESGRLVLEVQDDGVGFDPHQEFPGHLGLRSMQERVGALGGRLDLTSATGSGTRIRVTLPAEEENQGRERT